MEVIDIVNNICRLSFINILTYFVFIKLIGYKNNECKKIIEISIISILEAIICIAISKNLTSLVSLLINFILHSLVIVKITNNKLNYLITVIFIALPINYLIYLISILFSGIIFKLIFPYIQRNNIAILLFAIIIEIIIIHYFFRIKRFMNGLSFLKDINKVNNIGVTGLTFIGMAMVIYSLLGKFMGKKINTYLTTGIIMELICIVIWIRSKITKYYKQKMKEKTIEELEAEIRQKDGEIERVLEENKAIATINHKYSNRIKALEKLSNEILSKPEIIEKMKVEFGEDFGEIQSQIKQISEEYSREIKEKIKHDSKLPKTGVFGIDNILEYMKTEAEKNDIKFDLKVNANINYMVEKVINQSRLETLLGDHIKDAIIAITSSNNTYKSILTTISIIDDCYEICIYDTGIEFEIDTLLNLGTKAITTHKDTGGSGIGFMTTFETLKETKASLIIEEKHPMNNTDYTKAVKIRFDSKNEYRICSYRAEKIEEQKTDNRIIVEK